MDRTYGYKYDQQQGKTTAQIAKMIRADIKEAVKFGLLPDAPVKYSVKTQTYAGGASINITVSNWFDAWRVCDGEVYDRHDARLRSCTNYWCKAAGQFKDLPDAESHLVLTEEAAVATITLRRIMGAYNHDGSDSMVYHFDVNFYGDVRIETRREAEFRADQAEKKAARRAALDEAAASTDKRRVKILNRQGRSTVHDAAEVDGRIWLVCGATLWAHTVLWPADGQELTCSRCAKRDK